MTILNIGGGAALYRRCAQRIVVLRQLVVVAVLVSISVTVRNDIPRTVISKCLTAYYAVIPGIRLGSSIGLVPPPP